jgi:hypothetical protein
VTNAPPADGSRLGGQSGAVVAAPPDPSVAAVADQPDTTSYKLRSGLAYRSGSGGYVPLDATVRRNEAGVYTVMFYGLAAPSGTAWVYAYDSPATCDAVQWAQIGSDERVDVRCDAGPTPTDSLFLVGFRGSPA